MQLRAGFQPFTFTRINGASDRKRRDSMGRSGRVFSVAVALPLAMSALASGAVADELSDAAQLVLADPANADVNLDYALIAEGKGKYRLALAAYERVLLNDPNNVDAKRGL